MKKKQIALSRCLDYQNSLHILRLKWSKAGYYDRIIIEQLATHVKQQYEKTKTQYKICIKKDMDEFEKNLVELLF